MFGLVLLELIMQRTKPVRILYKSACSDVEDDFYAAHWRPAGRTHQICDSYKPSTGLILQMTVGTKREINMSGLKYFGDNFFKQLATTTAIRKVQEGVRRPPIYIPRIDKAIIHSYLRSGGGPEGDF